MDIKKHPKVALENYSKIFSEIGLVLVLFIVYNLLELKTYEREVTHLSGTATSISKELEEDTPIIDISQPPPPPPPQQPVIVQKVIVVEDKEEIEEILLKSTETDEGEAVIQTEYADSSGIVEDVEEEVIVEDVPFLVIEKVPVFPGCNGNQQELKKCFSKELQKFFVKKFNADLANELGLPTGRKRIVVLFKIDKYGKVRDIKARAPHPRLKKEAEKVINSLPEMTPGKQRGKPVGVRYTLPVSFFVQ